MQGASPQLDKDQQLSVLPTSDGPTLSCIRHVLRKLSACWRPSSATRASAPDVPSHPSTDYGAGQKVPSTMWPASGQPFSENLLPCKVECLQFFVCGQRLDELLHVVISPTAVSEPQFYSPHSHCGISCVFVCCCVFVSVSAFCLCCLLASGRRISVWVIFASHRSSKLAAQGVGPNDLVTTTLVAVTPMVRAPITHVPLLALENWATLRHSNFLANISST